MKVPFVKMHGASNDFIVVDEWKSEAVPEAEKRDFVVKVSGRHTGVGSDGVIFVHKSERADAKFVFYNPDGSLAEMCGNGIRCFAKYVYESQYVTKTDVRVETLAGLKRLFLTLADDKVDHVRVDMGGPQLLRGEIGILGNPKETFVRREVSVDGSSYVLTCVGIGNPHAILFVEDLDKQDIVSLGRKIRNMKELFPRGINVHFVRNEGKNRFRIRSYERGVEDETLACGTGVCASAVAAVLNELADPRRVIRFYTRGGELNVELGMEENRIVKVFLVGPAVEVFRGEIEFDQTEKFQQAAYSFLRDTSKSK